jgi:hypothetical protein
LTLFLDDLTLQSNGIAELLEVPLSERSNPLCVRDVESCPEFSKPFEEGSGFCHTPTVARPWSNVARGSA